MGIEMPTTRDDPEPASYFQLQRSRTVNPGEEKPSSDIAELAPLPASSPWAAELQSARVC
jgi:hypothetical protein